MTELTCTRTGSGPPMVLLHGMGLSRRLWDPVVPALAEHFDVIAVDLPGFGDSPPLPPEVEPSPAVLAASVAAFLDELGITEPHVVGNSLGGWVALELAGIRPAASITLLSPAGLWRRHTPAYCRISLRTSRWLPEHAARPLSRLVDFRLGRLLVFGQTFGRPTRMTPADARMILAGMGRCPGFEATFEATKRRRYLRGAPFGAPVTVAFGDRDRLLLRRQSRHLDQLPPGTRQADLPGCGHVPMGDDPVAVTALIRRSADRAAEPV
jgi:pimeloyl-ACP methyl ester carboxylesterase